MHEHEFQGQKLRHDHPGGELPHGYFEHPEDGSRATLASRTPLADALAGADKTMGTDLTSVDADRVARQVMSNQEAQRAADELTALRALAEAVRAQFAAHPRLEDPLPELRFTSPPEASAEDYARYAADAMNAATADDMEFIADRGTVTAYVHCLAHMSATFTLDEDRPYPQKRR